MYSKVFLLVAALVAVNAQDHYSHGHATSSQSIIRHDSAPSHGYNVQPIAVHAPVYQSAPVHQTALTVQHAAPVYSHAAPVYSHAAPVYSHAAPVYSHAAPVVSHSAPVYAHASSSISHSTPYITHAAPITQHAIPTQHYSAPVVTLQHGSGHYNQQYAQGHQEYYSHPKYEFQYSVNDPHTGDIKSQHEARDGDHVTGSYSLHEADGSVRTVHYNADAHNGFNAQVEHSQPSRHVTPVAAHAAPVLAHAAPIYSHSAPVYSHAAPVITHAAPVPQYTSYHH
ncbi:unnamed protein product [Leptosia nina]|uniref:Cuticle protein n=1 Tax=Leptosia nina TaxID=320188 RepID=A0AAV1JW54_9NEOP